ncbi:hypothetical protein I3760_09G176900 [Carya illinoinensis]|uniref:RING-type E3 ubiquitin transferase n=1 Tax=Carya illinoinensis TaxID=32201 RepID=A0A8T1PLJ2_CARIL|nr:probable E3 ubiquitin-protein ligase HIP1 isoform X2 [Carya illinoinensis]KAG2690208.1 hypothetical protein I3760_09G176900 [Carya illinoinensis]KAG6642974.1 hypothetical protein CIPAW_09G178000 [Carya illinoinensis]KAG6642978.1 hypothetical protein CIPAW_09G178000 [Carya illinoinensis]KAG6697026.1 hypothetical protein I3842_09G179300 [Carya illinoinensis]
MALTAELVVVFWQIPVSAHNLFVAFWCLLMGHRHLFSTSQSLENEHDQNWNHIHAEQHFVNLAGAGTSDNGSFFYPVENMSLDGTHFASHWSPAPRSTANPSSSHNAEVLPYQPDASGPSHDPFVHLPTAGTFSTVPDSYAQHASSSNYEWPTFHGVEGSFVDLTVPSGRGPQKRKSPGIPSVCERGSTSRYYNAGSSPDLPSSSELRLEKSSIDSQCMPWDHITMNPIYRGSGLSIRGEGSLRNVRSRSALDLESNLARTHLSTNPSYSVSHPIDHSSPVDVLVQASSALTRDRSLINMSPATGRVIVSDTSSFNHETDQFHVGSSSSNPSAEIGGYHHNFITSRNPVAPQNFHASSTQSVRGVRSSSFSQRSSPAFRASSSSLRLGHAAPSDGGLQLVAESYSPRHPRPLSTIGWRNGDRNGRSRISTGRYRSLPNEAGVHDRFSSEGFMIVDRSAWYGPRNMFDQHRDMMLDIDNMSYEDLLALGERIGNVSTGLSEDLISKCLIETIYCSSDQTQEEETCVICLEEYRDRDGVGTLKACGHDYHVSCIKKWLSMKNLCPVCKGSALADNMKDK